MRHFIINVSNICIEITFHVVVQEAYEAFPQRQKIELMGDRKNDIIALLLIQQSFNEIILTMIVDAAYGKEAWNCLKNEFRVRGSNTNQHQANFFLTEIVKGDGIKQAVHIHSLQKNQD